MLARLVLFAALVITPHAFAQEISLDELLSPDQLATEVGNPNHTEMSPLAAPGTWSDVQASAVYQEFPIVVVVDKSTQRLQLYHRGQQVDEFRVSTGRNEWENPPSGERYFSSTPNGWYSPQRYVLKYESRTWDATMRYSIFFNGGIALHATSPNHYFGLGKNNSGGCVRLTRSNAKKLWNLARSEPKAVVPQFTRSGQLTGKRALGSPMLIIVQGKD